MNRHISAAFAAALLSALVKPALAQTAPAQPPAAPSQPAVPAPATPPAPEAAPPSAPSAALEKEVTLQRADLDEQDARIAELEKQLKDLKKAEAPKPDVKKDAVDAPHPAAPPADDFPLKVTGYVQAQYEFHQDSEDQQQQGGALLNQNRFLLRRTRVKLSREWQYGGVMIELDANTVRGPAIGIYRAEVSLAYRNKDQAPLVQATLGLFDNPFGRELVESSRDRPFMERSYASRAFFPAEPDLGLRVSGQASFLRYSVAVVNGQPLGDRTGFILQDPNAHKDVLGRVGVDVTLPSAVRVLGGASVLNGKGYHPGSDATKNTLSWRDNVSEDGLVTLPEIIGVPGVAAQPAKSFDRWLLGVDLGAQISSKFGTTHLYGELSVGSNMDRNVFVADPVATGIDARELGWYLSLYQEFKQGPIAGFRVDQYNPNADFADSRGGKLVPLTQTITTYSPLVGFQVAHKARLVGQWDIIRDSLARNTAGVPVDRQNNVVTIRLQGEL